MVNSEINKINEALNGVKEFKNFELHTALDMGGYYAISLCPKGMSTSSDSYIVDGWHKVDKKTGKISGFSPMMDIEAFKKGMKSPLYIRGKNDAQKEEILAHCGTKSVKWCKKKRTKSNSWVDNIIEQDFSF